tara:strand:+ start:1598 stop:1741 length:144 start_codon:yes stop_codon:yes gene_type:complete
VEQNNLIAEVAKTDGGRAIKEIWKRNENAPSGFWIAFLLEAEVQNVN